MSAFFDRIKKDYLTIHVVIPLFIFLAVIYFFVPDKRIDQPPGILAVNPPTLVPISDKTSFIYKEYSITPLADYDLVARVLDKEKYYWGREADISPIDFLLGWKEMSDTSLLNNFDFHLSGRWYRWHTTHMNTLPLSREDINKELDNNHLIPATSLIKQQLNTTHVGQVVHITGFLVSLEGKDGYRWYSSLNIGSTGGPLSCKLIYVAKFEIIK